jgi:hypothetical protein
MATLALFAVGMAYVEAAIVVYLRELLYPNGFSFPLRAIPSRLIVIEVVRELATMLMLGAVAALAARRFWKRFAYFVFMFGLWDIFYYVWLKITLDWPSSLLEWDILLLIPLPWIGPVIAPILISVLMIVVGISVALLYRDGINFHPSGTSWLLAATGTALILFSFMWDINATLYQEMPQPYLWLLLIVGLVCYVIGFVTAYRRSLRLRRRS